ncbi:MAG TPA: GNAT family N-acetyltransferase [Solirubrobacteraceae bacterium]|nr:GNAT family N-acetyltransferase [Solirubrobacteraceae bacterium]
MSEPVADRHTERLRLRRVTEDDAASVVKLSTDPRTHGHSPSGVPTPEQAEGYARRFAEVWDTYGIGYWIVEYEGRDVGLAGVKPAMLGGRAIWNMYYRFDPAVHGRGLAAEATREAIAAARAHTPEWPVVVRTRPGNEPAVQLARAIGLGRRPDLDADGFITFAA